MGTRPGTGRSPLPRGENSAARSGRRFLYAALDDGALLRDGVRRGAPLLALELDRLAGAQTDRKAARKRHPKPPGVEPGDAPRGAAGEERSQLSAKLALPRERHE